MHEDGDQKSMCEKKKSRLKSLETEAEISEKGELLVLTRFID